MSESSIIQRYLETVNSLKLKTRWGQTGGYRDLLKICLPLIASTSSVSAMLFTDRLFLSHYSMDAIAASLPAGIAALTFSSFFLGLVSYVSIFAAQYAGARQPLRAASSMWQGIYASLIFGLLLASAYFIGPLIFAWSDHPPQVQVLETSYFRVLILFSTFDLLYVAMSSFLAGLGRTTIVMWISLAGAAINIPLDYFLIFGFSIDGVQIIPEWGVFGAAVATVTSWVLITLTYAIIIFNQRMEKRYGVFSQKKFDFKLFKRLVAYGSPGGLQFSLEIATFAYFALIVGKLGEFYLATNNIVFSIETLSFFPMIGVGQAVSIMVGQAIGKGAPQEGAEATKSGFVVSSIYLVMMMAVFLIFPDQLLGLFLSDSYNELEKIEMIGLGTILLRFMVIYGAFDGLYLCCFGAIRGAGDVWFPMLAMFFWGLFGLIVPTALLFYFDLANIYNLWLCLVLYILCLTSTGVWRYRSGRWRHFRVVEHFPS